MSLGLSTIFYMRSYFKTFPSLKIKLPTICPRYNRRNMIWRSKDELISDVLLWTPTYGRAKAGRPARTYIQQLCEDTGCNTEDLPEAMSDREKWRERVRDIRADGTTWWWWWWNVSSNPTLRSHSLFTFLIFLLFNLCIPRLKNPPLLTIVLIAGGRTHGPISFSRASVQSESPTASSTVWFHFLR